MNNVNFGHYRVRARVASFDRTYTGEGRRPEPGRLGLLKDTDGLVRTDGNNNTTRLEGHKGVVDRSVETGTWARKGGTIEVVSVKGGASSPEAVQ
ncbi:hypothetical protein A2U01_0067089, partial [Trifolium medium]|nr:hypothetical protein [Trifolium medium]